MTTGQQDTAAKEIKGASPTSNSAPREADFEAWPYVDRRQEDRRGGDTTFWGALFFRGQRASGRREGEDENIYVDVYNRKEVVLILSILVLNILDAYFTLNYIEKGGREANPFAQKLLDLGNTHFIYAKSVFVGICLIFLLVHKKFRHVNLALTILTSFYSLLLVYHIFLQARYYLR